MLKLFLAVFAAKSLVIGATCLSATGPAGLIECFLGTGVNDGAYQWGTCLSNAYIMQSSNGKYRCVDYTRTYCYYQCMLETYADLTGPVRGICKCSSNDTAQTAQIVCLSGVIVLMAQVAIGTPLVFQQNFPRAAVRTSTLSRLDFTSVMCF